MEAKIILGRIIQRLIDQEFAQVPGYNRFGFVETRANSLIVSRENGSDTSIPFSQLLKAIEGYKACSGDYNKGPTALRGYGITHVTSPIFALLHLLDINCYNL
jgi:hypothetical protein